MDAATVEHDDRLRGRERLVVDAADLGAVHRVGEVGTVGVDVEVDRAEPDLLVDGEGHAKRSARLVGADQVGDRGHDLGDAGLVVGAEERRAVGRDDVVADALSEQLALVR